MISQDYVIRGSCGFMSSIVNEVIRGNFKLLYFFYEKISHIKSIKKHKNVKQATFFFLDVFYEHKKHKKHKKHKT